MHLQQPVERSFMMIMSRIGSWIRSYGICSYRKKYMCYVAYSGEICYSSKAFTQERRRRRRTFPRSNRVKLCSKRGIFPMVKFLVAETSLLSSTRQQARFRLSSKPFCCLVQLLILQNLVSHNQIKWIGLWVQPEADGVACSWCLWGGCGEMYGRLFIRNQWSMKPVTCCCCWLLLWVLLADIVY